MTTQEIINLIVTVLSGIAVAIPVVIKLVEVSKEASKNKNWNQVVSLVAALMAEAEQKLTEGATKKQWVIGMLKTAVLKINYEMTEADWVKVDNLIDTLCEMAKTVNATA